MNIQELSAALAARRTTSVDLVKAAFKRMDETNDFNAIGVRSPLALDQAKQLDEERSIGRLRGPLHGIPVVIKDNILYQDGTPTTANSYALRDLMPPYNALIVERLIAAGAIIVGKANLSELANFLTTEGMPNGYGSMYGQVIHPYDESVDPLGSSTGSAVAVALDIVPVSIGSETNGSLIAPALFNQVVTLKPTQGVVPQDGIIPISPSQDIAGPMAKTVKDVALMMDVISGKPGGFTTRLSQPPKGKVLWLTMPGWLEAYIPSEWVETMKTLAIPRLKAIGLEVEERIVTPADIPNEQVLLAEYAPAMTAFLQTLGPDFPLQSMEDLIREYKANPERAMKYGITLLEQSLTHAKALDDPDYVALKKAQFEMASFAETTLHEGYVAIVTVGWTDFGAIHGNPSVNVPEASWDKHPRGVTFIGKRGYDDSLLALAHQYQQLVR